RGPYPPYGHGPAAIGAAARMLLALWPPGITLGGIPLASTTDGESRISAARRAPARLDRAARSRVRRLAARDRWGRRRPRARDGIRRGEPAGRRRAARARRRRARGPRACRRGLVARSMVRPPP